MFLNEQGLEVFAQMLNRLPNDCLPNSTFRKQILTILLDLPINTDHIRQSSIGKALTKIEKSGEEIESNLQLIKELKHRWSRMIYKEKF